MWLSRLAFTYVVFSGFRWCLAGFVAEVVPQFLGRARVARQFHREDL
jgi:hypothetical protein